MSSFFMLQALSLSRSVQGDGGGGGEKWDPKKKREISWLVGALNPVNQEGLHKGRTQTLPYLKVIHFTSHHTTSHVFEPIYISWALNTGTCPWQGDLFYSAGLHRSHVLATANIGKLGRGFGKNAGEWTGRVEIRKKSPAVSVACMAIY